MKTGAVLISVNLLSFLIKLLYNMWEVENRRTIHLFAWITILIATFIGDEGER